MLRSPRTHVLAFAVLVMVAGGSAAARQYYNQGGNGSVSQGVVPEINDQAISAANPMPAMLAPTAAGGIVPIASTGSALVAKAGPGNLYGYNATAGGSAAFVAVLNATVAPAAGAVIAPLECSAVPASGTYRTRQDIPDRYSVGIVLVFTSSCSTYTAVSPVLIAAVVQ